MLQWTRRVSTDVSVRELCNEAAYSTIVSIASMTLNAYRGLTELPPFSLDLMKSYAAKKLTVLFKLRAPNSIPFVFTSLRCCSGKRYGGTGKRILCREGLRCRKNDKRKHFKGAVFHGMGLYSGRLYYRNRLFAVLSVAEALVMKSGVKHREVFDRTFIKSKYRR